MEAKKIEHFIVANSKYLPTKKLPLVKQKLLEADDSKEIFIETVSFIDPNNIMIMSICLGWLGVDRYILGDMGMGVLKMLTGGTCGILWIMDIVSSQERAREKNFTELMMMIAS